MPRQRQIFAELETVLEFSNVKFEKMIENRIDVEVSGLAEVVLAIDKDGDLIYISGIGEVWLKEMTGHWDGKKFTVLKPIQLEVVDRLRGPLMANDVQFVHLAIEWCEMRMRNQKKMKKSKWKEGKAA